MTRAGVPVVLNLQPGAEVFLRLDWSHGLNRPPIPKLTVVRREQAEIEMRFLSYVDARRVLSPAVPKQDPREPVTPRLKTRY